MKSLEVESQIPVRLDKYLVRKCKLLTQGIIQKAIRNGQIKINGERLKSASTRVMYKDKINLADYMYDEMQNFSEKSKRFDTPYFSSQIIKLANKLLSDYLVFECEYFLIINKPSGLATQGGNKIFISVDDALKYLNHINDHNFKLVHRLDKETSGLMVIAKGYENSVKLGSAFKNKLIYKEYIAISRGNIKDKNGIITTNLMDIQNQDEESDCISTKLDKIKEKKNKIINIINQKEYKNTLFGKEMVTKYELISKYRNYFLIKFIPITGRKHQIRLHSRKLGCPIVGDKKYGGVPFSGLLLQSKKIIISKEVFSKEFCIEIPVSNQLTNYCTHLFTGK